MVTTVSNSSPEDYGIVTAWGIPWPAMRVEGRILRAVKRHGEGDYVECGEKVAGSFQSTEITEAHYFEIRARSQKGGTK